MADGIYTMTYRGAADWGMGMLVLRRGQITGADTAGGLYNGRYIDQSEAIVLEMIMTVPAGVALAQGTPPRDRAYDVQFNARIPKRAIDNAQPVLVELPPGPVNVIVKRLRRLDD
jgi:hypothetical protein